MESKQKTPATTAPASAVNETLTLYESGGSHSVANHGSHAPVLRRLGPYELIRELGRGGMGSVYFGQRTDDVYRKPVAVKLVRPECGTELITRFHREREILGALDHPNIARLLDGGAAEDGLPYLVMDFVDGQPIDEYCDEHRVPIDGRLRLFQAVCSAVEYAHAQAIVHRDLKPANILVDRQGRVKLLDFGIAKLTRAEPAHGADRLTRTGMLLMTPEYASPEQVSGEAVGPPSDIYALGVILFELLTGHSPYRTHSPQVHEWIRVVREQEPLRPSVAVTQAKDRSGNHAEKIKVTPETAARCRQTTAAELRRQLAGDLDNIVLTALRKEPGERYRSAAELSADIQRHLDGQPVAASGGAWSYRARKSLGRHRWAVTAVVLIVAANAAGLLRINPLAAAAALFFAAVIGLRYVLTSAEYGEGYAQRKVFGSVIAVACLSTAFAGLGVLMLTGPALASALLLLLGIRFVFPLLRWPRLQRWAGQLLLDASRPRPRRIGVFFAVSIAVIALWSVGAAWAGLSPLLIASFLFALGSFAAGRFCGAGRLEVRARGILGPFCILLPWRKIRSYSWEPSNADVAILRIEGRRFGIRVPIAVPASAKTPLTVILDDQLSEWPALTNT